MACLVLYCIVLYCCVECWLYSSQRHWNCSRKCVTTQTRDSSEKRQGTDIATIAQYVPVLPHENTVALVQLLGSSKLYQLLVDLLLNLGLKRLAVSKEEQDVQPHEQRRQHQGLEEVIE